jgi:hypothetical protein
MSMITVNSDYSITLNPAQPNIEAGNIITVALNPSLTACDIKFNNTVNVNGVATAANTAIVFNSMLGYPGLTAASNPNSYDLIPTAGSTGGGSWKLNTHPIHVSG